MKATKQASKPRRRSWTTGPRQKPARRKVAPPAAPQPAPSPKPAPISLAGLSPRERLDAIHAHQALLDLRQRQGELVERSEIEAGHAEMREVIRSDLLGTLPLRLASKMSGKTHTPAEVRAAVLEAVREILKTWHQAGTPVPEGKAP